MGLKFNWKKFELFLGFLAFGVIMGVTEDLIAVGLATGQPITWRIVFIVTLVAIPFAIFGEIIIDRYVIPGSHRKRR